MNSNRAISFPLEAARKISSIRQLDEQIDKSKGVPNRVTKGTEESNLTRQNKKQISIQTEFITIPKRPRKQRGFYSGFLLICGGLLN